MEKNFKRHAIVKYRGKFYQCICADEFTAVFAYIGRILGEERFIDMKKLFAVSNRHEKAAGFKHELILEGRDGR